MTLVFAFQVGNLKLILFPLISWCQFSELKTLMRQLGPCFEYSLGWPFVTSDCSYLLICSPIAVDPGTSQLCQCVLNVSTQLNEILCIFQGGTGMKWFWIHNCWQLWDARNPLPCPRGCLHHYACSLTWDAPAGIPQPSGHSFACSYCVHIPVQQNCMCWRGSRSLIRQLLSKMPNYGVVFLSPASEC